MIHINKFMDRISVQEKKNSKDVVIPISDAKGLRDEIMRLLTDLHDMKNEKKDEIIQVKITGGSFK